MLEDFELEQRYLKTFQSVKNKWQSENKKYLERVEHMKEKKEENYTNRRNSLLKEYNKKQKEIENQLYKIRESKEGERKKLLLLRSEEHTSELQSIKRRRKKKTFTSVTTKGRISFNSQKKKRRKRRKATT